MAQDGQYSSSTIYGFGNRPAAAVVDAVNTESTDDTAGLLRIPRKPVGSGGARPAAKTRGIPLPALKPPVPRKQVERRSGSAGRRPNSLSAAARSSIADYSPIPEESSAELRLDALGPGDFSSANATINSRSERTASSRSKPPGFDSEDGSSMRSMAWRPPWLRRRRLLAFASVLSLCMMGVFLLVVLCDRNGGLATVKEKNAFLWTSGPTAAVVFILVVWNRIEYQGLRFMPWIAAYDTKSEVDDGLDYVSDFFVLAFFRALKRRHWLAVVMVTTGVCLKVQVVLSAGMLKMARAPWKIPTPIAIQNTIVAPDPAAILNEGVKLNAYSAAIGMRDFGLGSPFGATDRYAYQQFEVLGADNATVGSAALKAEVDGVTVDLSCISEDLFEFTFYESRDDALDGDEARVYRVGIDFPEPFGYIQTYNTTFAGNTDRGGEAKVFAAHQLLKYLVDEDPAQYDGPRLLMVQLKYSWSTESGSIPRIQSTKALMCQHAEMLVPLEVTKTWDNSTARHIEGNENRTMIVDMEELFHYSLPRGTVEYFSPSASIIESNAVPGPIAAAALLSEETSDQINPLADETSAAWEESLAGFYRRFGALVLNERARSSNSGDEGSVVSIGTLESKRNRLVVDHGMAFTVASVFGVAALMIIATALFLAPTEPIAPMYPDTVMAAIVMAAEKNPPKSLAEKDPARSLAGLVTATPSMYHHGSPAASSKAFFGSDDTTAVAYSAISAGGRRRRKSKSAKAEHFGKRWGPTILSTSIRIVMVFAMYGFGAGLIALLKVSEANKGFLAEEPGYTFLPRHTLAVLPTLVFFLLALYIIAVDGTMRRFAPLGLFTERYRSAANLFVNFIDCVGPKAMLVAMRHGAWNVVLSVTAAFFALLMTILSGTLLSIKSVSVESAVQLHEESWFAASNPVLNVVETNSTAMLLHYQNHGLFGGSNGSPYPVHTYDNLAFNAYSISNATQVGKGGNITATVPALRLISICKELEGPENNDDGPSLSSLTRSVNDTGCDGDASSFDIKPFENDPSAPVEGSNVFARSISFDGCPKSWYYFGDFVADDTLEDGTSNSSSSLWQCDYTWEIVQVAATFLGPNMTIDHSNPPEVLKGTTITMFPQLPLPQWSTNIFPDVFPAADQEDDQTRLVDPELRWLIAEDSGGPFGRRDLQDAVRGAREAQLSLKNGVVGKLTENRAFLAVQIAARNNMLGRDEASTDPAFQIVRSVNGPEDATTGILKDSEAQRLVVNASIAYVLLTTVVLLLIVNIWALLATAARRLGLEAGAAWVVDMDLVGIARENPGSTRAMERLITSGNLLDWVPRDLRGLSQTEIETVLPAMHLKLGWFWDGNRRKRVFALGVATGTGDGHVFVGNRILGGSK